MKTQKTGYDIKMTTFKFLDAKLHIIHAVIWRNKQLQWCPSQRLDPHFHYIEMVFMHYSRPEKHQILNVSSNIPFTLIAVLSSLKQTKNSSQQFLVHIVICQLLLS